MLKNIQKKAVLINCKYNSNNNRGDETLFKINIVINYVSTYLKIWFLTILSIPVIMYVCTRVM